MLIALLMASTGWLALREGATRYMLPFQMQDVGAHTAQMAQALRADPTVPHIQQYSNELAALASLTSPRRFVDSRLVEHGVYLSQMPKLNRSCSRSTSFWACSACSLAASSSGLSSGSASCACTA